MSRVTQGQYEPFKNKYLAHIFGPIKIRYSNPVFMFIEENDPKLRSILVLHKYWPIFDIKVSGTSIAREIYYNFRAIFLSKHKKLYYYISFVCNFMRSKICVSYLSISTLSIVMWNFWPIWWRVFSSLCIINKIWEIFKFYNVKS